MLQLLQLSRVVVPLYKVDGLFSPLCFPLLSSPFFREWRIAKNVSSLSLFFSQRDERTHAKTTQVI